MAEYAEGYPEPVDVSSSDGPAEENHEVGASKRGSKDADSKPKRKRSCPVYFGVKSYLHQFYEDHTFKDPSVYEDDDHQYLLQPHQRRRRCTPIWWKLFMWIGVTLLLFGVIGILIGYLVPPRHVLIGDSDTGQAYIDQQAQEYNTTLDMCKLIGLIFFCVGGLTLAMALLFPSFLTRYCEDEPISGDGPAIKVPLQPEASEKGALNPFQMIIPASSKIKEVQPSKKSEQQMLTQNTTK
ncbi:neurensin-1 [Biomphalaria pfeifferi]|uniref:Neurensin-1 n=1 Tax=Biomphalaria pfeifferi TaxID=112525 RepID=A0AAD8C9U5_BIOPF|nr:neurensin-1 [Biomphalaria pfeifferi]